MSNYQFLQILFFNLQLICITLFSCSDNYGFLEVKSIYPGKYELYRIIQDSSVVLSSQKELNYNEKVKLKSGTYLILADCSSQTVIIYPHKNAILFVNTIRFNPPFNTTNSDLFMIHCSRFDKANIHQSFKNTYVLNVLQTNKEILVSTKTINLKQHINKVSNTLQSPKSQEIIFNLGSIIINNFNKSHADFKYFVYPNSIQKFDITLSQNLGERILLIPDKYIVELNGTKYPIEIEENKIISITPGLFQTQTNIKFTNDTNSILQNDSVIINLNKNAILNINETYPLLPGTHTIQFNNNEKSYKINIKPKETTTIKIKNLILHSACPPFENLCTQKSTIFLFEENTDTYFAKGKTDIPILFIEPKVQVGIDNSIDIRYALPSNQEQIHIETGILFIKPIYTTHPLQNTDLIRIEAIYSPISGKTYDIPINNVKTPMLLPKGKYLLKHFITTKQSRHFVTYQFNVKANNINVLEPLVFIPSTKLQKINDYKKNYRRKKITRIKNMLLNQKYFIPPTIQYF